MWFGRRNLHLVVIRHLWLVAVLLSCGGWSSHAAEGALTLLQQPATFGAMRHALAPGFSDPEDFTIGDCRSQRNLDAAGRRQARATGAALRAAGLRFDRVLTSQWCRCRETAELLNVGPVEELPALNSFFEEPAQAKSQTAALRAFMAALPVGEKILLVSHYVNISAYLNVAVSSGEMVIAERKSTGDAVILSRFLIAP